MVVEEEGRGRRRRRRRRRRRMTVPAVVNWRFVSSMKSLERVRVSYGRGSKSEKISS